MDLEYIPIIMELYTQEYGKMNAKQEQELKFGKTVQYIKVTIQIRRKKDLVLI